MAWEAQRTEGVSEPQFDSQIRPKVAHERSSFGQTRNNDQASIQTDALSYPRQTRQPVPPESRPKWSFEPQHWFPLSRTHLPELLQLPGHLKRQDLPCQESPGVPTPFLQQCGALRGVWRQSFRSDIVQTAEAASM